MVTVGFPSNANHFRGASDSSAECKRSKCDLLSAACCALSTCNAPMEPATPSAGSSTARTLRPFVWWIFFSALLLTSRHHQQEERRATIQFTVSVEGREERPEYRAELNDLSFEAGGHSGLWLKRLGRAA